MRLLKQKLEEEKDAEINSEACIEWAFAGRSHSKARQTHEDGKTKLSHTVWEHWIDSKSDSPAVDEGDMSVQENGDVLERGKSTDAATGLVYEYEELWHDLEAVPLGKKHNRSSLVLMAEDPERNLKGMAVKIGGWCQAIVKVEGALTVERWELKPAASTDTEDQDKERKHEIRTRNDWVRTFKMGAEPLPCEYMCSNTDGKIGLNGILRYWPKQNKFTNHMRSTEDTMGVPDWKIIEEYYF